MIQQIHLEAYIKRTESSIWMKYLHMHVHRSIVHSQREGEATQIYIDGWIDKHNSSINTQQSIMQP